MPEPVTSFEGSPFGGSPCWGGQLSVGYEGAFHIRAFQDDDDEDLEADINVSSSKEKKTCLFNIFGDTHNVLGGLKGFNSDTRPGQLSQQFTIDDESCDQGLFKPTGCLRVPLNLLLAQKFYFSHGLSLGLYLPVISAELKNVRFKRIDNGTTQEGCLEDGFLKDIEQVSGLKLGGWKRTGIGDFIAQMWWMRDFVQSRPILSNVRVIGRLGVIFPTGKKTDEDRLLAFPFGNDGSWGLQFAGGLDLTFCYTIRGGIDAEFIYLFGNTRCRRVKTAEDQTELFFLNKVPVFKEFGLGQQYNIYLESCNFWRNTSFKINYQFLKQNDDRVDVASDRIDSRIANTAENLFDWSAHSLIFMARHDIWRDYEASTVFPSVRAWVKWGFNGKRAFIANTVGLQLNLAF